MSGSGIPESGRGVRKGEALARNMATSAAMLMYRAQDELEVLLAHPGGPLWHNKDNGAWSIPKGEIKPGESLLLTAQREFTEETGLTANPPYIELGHITQKSSKVVHAWAFQGDCDPTTTRSNTFKMEWPPKSGHIGVFPEIDRTEFFNMSNAMLKINTAQGELLVRLANKLA